VKKTQLLQLTGGIVLAGAGLYIFFRDVDIHELWRHLHATPWWVLFGVMCMNFITLWLRSLRWNIILPSSDRASRRDLFGIVSIGFLINNFLPARLGEAARVVLLWKRNHFTAAQSVGSLVLERFLDILVFSSYFFLPVFFYSSAVNAQALHRVLPLAGLMAGFFTAAVVVFMLYALFPSAIKKTARILLGVVPVKFRHRVLKIAVELVSNLDWVFSIQKSIAVIALSFLMVFCHVVMMILLLRESSFGILGGMFGAACAALGAAIPLSPGYIGTLHAALQQGLVMIGIAKSAASAATILYHGISYVTVTIIGLLFYFRMDISFKEIGRAKKTLQAEEDAKTEC
jgi:glycosyltransferase 2 family protein